MGLFKDLTLMSSRRHDGFCTIPVETRENVFWDSSMKSSVES